MLIDYTDFCRRCKGTGTIPERTERGTIINDDCDLCGGTGYRTVRLTRKPNAAPLTDAARTGTAFPQGDNPPRTSFPSAFTEKEAS